MVNYFAGFVTCWLILGLFSFIGDWQEWYHSDKFWGVLCFLLIKEGRGKREMAQNAFFAMNLEKPCVCLLELEANKTG